MQNQLKRLCSIIIIVLFVGCGKGEFTWQEHYDLGMQYLTEGNYEQAILSFTSAIEIDAKQALGFIGRGHAYIGLGETEENLTAALADYEMAVMLDETNADAYLGIVDVYIRQGEYEKALKTLEKALEKTGNAQSIQDKIDEIKSGVYIDSSQNIRRSNDYEADGTLTGYTEFDYDYLGRKCSWRNYNREWHDDGSYGEIALGDYCEVTFDEDNRAVKNQFYAADGTPTYYDSFIYNENNLKTEQYRYESDGSLIVYFYFYYDDLGREIKYEGYNSDGSMYNYWISEYDANGKLISEKRYNGETGELDGYSTFE